MISAKFIPQIYKSIPDILRNGPKGIILSFLNSKRNKAIGKAIKVAKKILQIAIGYPITSPIRNINLMSPPPKDSCLNIMSPTFLTRYIVANEPKPARTFRVVSYRPQSIISRIIIAKEAKIKTSSNIIIYSISLIIMVIKLDTKMRAIISSSDKSKT